MVSLFVYYENKNYTYNSPVRYTLFRDYQECYPNLMVKIFNNNEELEVKLSQLKLA